MKQKQMEIKLNQKHVFSTLSRVEKVSSKGDIAVAKNFQKSA
jgi:hypothetical protein